MDQDILNSRIKHFRSNEKKIARFLIKQYLKKKLVNRNFVRLE